MAEQLNQCPPCGGCGERRSMRIETQSPDLIKWRCKECLTLTEQITDYAKVRQVAGGFGTFLSIAGGILTVVGLVAGVASGDPKVLQEFRKALNGKLHQ